MCKDIGQCEGKAGMTCTCICRRAVYMYLYMGCTCILPGNVWVKVYKYVYVWGVHVYVCDGGASKRVHVCV